MTKIRSNKKMTVIVASMIVLSCMVFQVLAASLVVTEIWGPATVPQANNTVYMDNTEIEKIAWKTFSSNFNPNFTGVWTAKSYVGNDDEGDFLYSYSFDADTIVQSEVNQQPYYLYTTSDMGDVVNNISMGCRTKFPVAMEVTVPTGLGAYTEVVVEYVAESCNGYVNHSATGGSELAGTIVDGYPEYLDGYANTFTTSYTETDANGYVTFTTWHGGDYTITVD